MKTIPNLTYVGINYPRGYRSTAASNVMANESIEVEGNSRHLKGIIIALVIASFGPYLVPSMGT